MGHNNLVMNFMIAHLLCGQGSNQNIKGERNEEHVGQLKKNNGEMIPSCYASFLFLL